MQPISPDALQLVRDKAPDFLKAIDKAQGRVRGTGRVARLALRLDTFGDDPFTLYACLWYAASQQVDILLRAQRGQYPTGASAAAR